MNKDMVTKFVTDEVLAKNLTEIEWNGNTIKVNKMIDDFTARTIIENVVDSCFDTDGTYDPSGKDFLFRALVVATYSDVELPDDNAVKYAFLFGTDIFDAISSAVNSTQLGMMYWQIDEMVKVQKQRNADVITNKLMELESTLSAVMESMKNIATEVNPDDIKSLVGAITETKFDEAKLAKAIVEEQTKG